MKKAVSSEERGCLLLQVDAFASEAFRGNPAAICFVDGGRSDQWMQSVAAEMNLAETAFLCREDNGFGLRWFTPTVEVPLCGHATLASAHAIWQEGLGGDTLRFSTLSGPLYAAREGEWIRLDFPLKEPVEAAMPSGLAAALSVVPLLHAQAEGFHLVEVESADAVRRVDPDMIALGALGEIGVIVTSRGEGEVDFVSRMFAPGLGIDEDPVTGAAHCMLAPFWAERLGRRELTGYQASARGGVVRVRTPGGDVPAGRVHLLGQAVTTLRGRLLV